ncbi:uncharacterized protein F54H12.2-like [Copidosoma floridanum]|uniref:uncharacterized protein F54H12.2-like n=1 Tax=Copidosoma floridanum TaxID=29053 RepID=UPI0006C9C884|nr:uncharacterized protein F54H12.2-like [Copidosoma floridanum]
MLHEIVTPRGFVGNDDQWKTHNVNRVETLSKTHKIKEWLKGQVVYTLHKTIRRKFPSLFYDVNALDDLWETDLIQLTSIKNYNIGMSYILVAIDILSKFVWAHPLCDKTCSEVTTAFKKILNNKHYRYPKTVQTDQGKEFLGSEFQQLLKHNGIKFRILTWMLKKFILVEVQFGDITKGVRAIGIEAFQAGVNIIDNIGQRNLPFKDASTNRATKSGINLKRKTALEASRWVYYKPVSSLTDKSPIEFVINSQNKDYLDLDHTMLRVNVKLIPYNKDTDASVAPMTPSNNAYPYRVYIETIFNYGPAAKTSHLSTSLWETDVAGEMDELPGSEKNISLTKRHEYIKDGMTVDLMGHLNCDVFNQDKLLLNGVEVRLRLVRSKDAFCLMDASTMNYSVSITEATLLVRRVKVSPTVLIAHAKALASTTAKYPITRVEVKSFTMHSGITGDRLGNVILGQLPKRTILGFVDNKAFNGDTKLNPFNTQNYSINFLSLYVDGVQIPSKPLQPTFTGSHWNLVKNGSVRIENLTTCYSTTMLEIDLNCQIVMDFNA